MRFGDFAEAIVMQLKDQRATEVLAQRFLVVYKPVEFQPKDRENAQIEDIKFGEDGGIRTYLKGKPYPARFHSEGRVMDSIAAYKKILPLIARNAKGFNALITLLFLKGNLNIFNDWFKRYFELYPIRCKEEHYSTPVRELRRVLKDYFNNIPYVLDAISVILEFDSAYRYRFQDIAMEINKVEFNKKPLKEIKRLTDLWTEREVTKSGIYSLRKLFPLFRVYLMFSPKKVKLLKDIINNVNIDEIKFNEEDEHYIKYYGDYNFLGKSYESRNKG